MSLYFAKSQISPRYEQDVPKKKNMIKNSSLSMSQRQIFKSMQGANGNQQLLPANFKLVR